MEGKTRAQVQNRYTRTLVKGKRGAGWRERTKSRRPELLNMIASERSFLCFAAASDGSAQVSCETLNENRCHGTWQNHDSVQRKVRMGNFDR